jgi:hypothetical protein
MQKLKPIIYPFHSKFPIHERTSNNNPQLWQETLYIKWGLLWQILYQRMTYFLSGAVCAVYQQLELFLFFWEADSDKW